MAQSSKLIVYQVFTRLFGNRKTTCKPNGNIEENGVGKFEDFDDATLLRIREMGATHVWFTGVIRHASQTDYSDYGIPAQHPDVVKGRAGSPYAITDYYDVDPDMATDVNNRMMEWEQLIERTHRAGLKVIIDFVPNHVARQYHSICKPEGVKDLGEDDDTNMHFSTRNNFYYCWGQPLDLSDIVQAPNQQALQKDSISPAPCPPLPAPEMLLAPYSEQPAKATGNDQFTSKPGRNDWYETVKLNYGIDYCDAGGRSEHFDPIPDTWSKMTDILLFWAQKGVDGFRCDMAEMVPAAFWHWATDKVKYIYPEKIFIGEVYDPAQYRNYIAAGFDYLYDKVGMYDCVRDVICGRRWAADITAQWQKTDDIRDHMLYFLENHDEQRIASDFFAGNAQKGIPGLIVSALLMSNPLMIYAGQEFGERGMDAEGFSGRDGRTTIFDYWTVDTLRRGYYDRRRLKKEERQLCDTYQKVMRMANDENALREGVSFDLMYVNPQLADRQFAFLRKSGTDVILVVANFDEQAADVDVNIPKHAFDFLQIPERSFSAVDLLTGEKVKGSLSSAAPVRVSLPALGGAILKLKL